MRFWPWRIFAALLIAIAALGSAEAKSRAPIKLIAGATPEQQIIVAIATRALKKSGFKFQLIDADGDAALSALTGGGAHAHLTMPSHVPGLPSAIETRTVISLGGLAANKPDEPLMKIVSPSLKKKWPYAQKMFKRMVLKPDLVAALAAQANDGTPVNDVAATWWKTNKKTWKPWIAASKNWMKP